MRTVVTGIGWVNTSGYAQGRREIFSPGCPGNLPRLLPKSLFRRSFQRFGRLDEYSRLGVAAIALALKDAELDVFSGPRNIALLSSTVYGCLSTDDEYYNTVLHEDGRLASPSLFAYTLPNSFLGEAAIHFGLSGATYVVNESLPSTPFALMTALASIKAGEHEAVIVGQCDYGPPRVLGVENNFIPGALFFVLQNDEATRHHLAYGELTQGNGMNVFFNAQEVTDLDTLAGMCTKRDGIPKEVSGK